MSAFSRSVHLRALQTPRSISSTIMDFEIQVVSNGAIRVLRCRGRLIYGPEAAELDRAARQAIDSAKEVVFEMSGVTQIDSGGVGALGSLYIAAHNRQAEIKLAALPPRIAEILRITGLALLFDVRNSEGDAVTAFVKKEKSPRTWLEAAETT
jgi:anti-anti-sigma factor